MTTSLKFNPFTKKLDYVGSGGGPGSGILTINTIGPDGGGDFTLESLDGSITFAPVANGLNLSATATGTTSYVLDAGGPVSPVAGVLTLNGIGGNTTGTTGAGEVYVNNLRWLTSFVVDANATPGQNATYQTIQSAINAAFTAGGGEVVIRDSATPYTENLTLRANVNISSLTPEGRITNFGGYGVTIAGNHTLSGNGLVSFKGINFTSTAGTTITATGATALGGIAFINCGANVTGDFSNLSASGGFSVISAISTGFTATGSVCVVGAGCVFASFSSQFTSTGGTAFVATGNCTIQGSTVSALNTAVEIVDAGGSFQFDDCQIGSTTGALFTAAGQGTSYNTTWNCNTLTGFYVDGPAGTYAYNNDTVVGPARLIASGLTQNRSVWRPRALTAAAATTDPIYGVCAFDSSTFTATDGFIQLAGGSGPAIQTLTPDSGGPIAPVAGNINLQGLGGNVTGSLGAGEVYVDNEYWHSAYVVDVATTPGLRGSYTTIQSAIDAAFTAGGGNVFVRPSSTPYVENLTFKNQVNLFSTGGDGRLTQFGAFTAAVQGNHTVGEGVLCTIEGIGFTSSSGDVFTVTAGAAPAIVGLRSCGIVAAGGTSFVISTTGGAPAIVSTESSTVTSNSLLASVGSGCILACNLSGLSTTDSIGITAAANAQISFNKSSLQATDVAVDLTGSGANISGSFNDIGAGIGLRMVAGASGSSSNSNWFCNDVSGFYITGAGSYLYANDNIQGSAQAIDPGITASNARWRPRAQAIASHSTNADYGVCAFDSASFTVNDGFVQLAGGGSPVTAFNLDTGGPINPVAGVITLNGIGGNITGTTGAGEIFVDNEFWLSPYVVDPNTTPGSRGSFSTIQSAIDAANGAGGGTVYVRQGTYTENLVLHPNISIIGVCVDGIPGQLGDTNVPKVVGNITYSEAGACQIERMYLQATTGTVLEINNTAGQGFVLIRDCTVEALSGDDFNLATTGGGTGVLFGLNSLFLATGFVGQVNADGSVQLEESTLNTSGNVAFDVKGFCTIVRSVIAATNVGLDITATTGVAGITYSTISSAIGASFTTTGTISSQWNNWQCNDLGGFYITGAGTYQYNDDKLYGTATDIDPATSVTNPQWRPRATAAANATLAYAGTASFDSGDFTVTDGFVQLNGSGNGTTTTVGAVTGNVITIPLGATPGTYQFEARVAGFEATTPASAGYNIYATIRTDGATATLVGNQDIFNEDTALAAADAYFTVSGNNAVLQVLGVTALTIDWSGESKLTFVS